METVSNTSDSQNLHAATMPLAPPCPVELKLHTLSTPQ